MRYPLKLKKHQIESVFSEKLNIKTISIESKYDVKYTINILLNFIELENTLTAEDCSFNFFNNELSFQLKLNNSKTKQDFFDSIKKFTDYFNI